LQRWRAEILLPDNDRGHDRAQENEQREDLDAEFTPALSCRRWNWGQRFKVRIHSQL